MQKSRHVDDDVQIYALDPFYEMDGRRAATPAKCRTGIEEKMSEISREVKWLRSGHVSTFRGEGLDK